MHTRLQVPEAGVPDLVVVCRGQTTDWVIIENKLKAEEGKDQTQRYAQPQVVERLSERLDLADAENPKLRFLTLFPDQEPEWGEFEPRCYSSLVQSRPLLDRDGTLAHRLASDWLDLLKDFYAFQDLDPGEPLLDKLSGMPALEAGYLAFRSLIRSLIRELSPSSGLELDYCYRSSQSGRRYYGAVIAKPGWKSGGFDYGKRPWTISEDNRHIHIEPQYHILEESLKIYVHYETNPYYTVSTLKESADLDQYEDYNDRRNAFREVFISRFREEVHPAHVRTRRGSNQLANVEVPLLGNASVRDIQESMEKKFGAAARAVDRTLADKL